MSSVVPLSKTKKKTVSTLVQYKDAYLLIRDDLRVVRWANEHLIKEMQWQELPEIQHLWFRYLRPACFMPS